jgi:hypothetical protein
MGLLVLRLIPVLVPMLGSVLKLVRSLAAALGEVSSGQREE